ncbi:MAG: DNA alkylation repair protein [Selenomonadales bacterium]|nr:DNA alkylation repair protein [Selenomonadales bacterium]
MTREEVRQLLEQLKEDEYQKFSSSLLPTIDPNRILGVRVPKLRSIARRIVRNDPRAYLAESSSDIYEEIMIEGFVIGMADMTFTERCGYIASFIKRIDNWAICDSFCSGLKFAKDHPDAVWDWIELYFPSRHPYEVRFAIVMAIFYFAEDKYSKDFFEHLDHIRADEYYVKMAIAWAISVYYVKAPEATKRYLREHKLDLWTYRKALTKIIESNRVSEQDKEWIREFRSQIKK